MGELRRELGLFEVTVYGVGLILGAGIYAILGEAAGLAGESIGAAFLLAAAVATPTGLSYAELASVYPEEEGDYLYVREAFGSEALSGVTALLRTFVGVVSAAAVALAFAGYLSSFVRVPAVPVAVALVAAAGAVNFWGIEFTSRLNLLFTAVEVAGLLVVVWVGAPTWGTVDALQAPNGVSGVVRAAFLVFFAYIGFGSVVNVSGEVTDARRTVPRAILLAIGTTTVLYVAVGVSAVGVVDWQVLGRSASPLATVAAAGWGPVAFTAVGVVALFSTTNTVLILQVSTSRLLFGVAKEEYRALPSVLSRVHTGRQTPYVAVAAVAVATAAFTVLADVGQVASLANFALLVVFALVNAALLRLRYARPDAARPFRAPLNVGRLSLTAVAGLLACLALLAFSLTGLG